MPKASPKPATPPEHDLQAVTRLERVNAPKQARSEKRLHDILEALEFLLDGRPFEEITIPDIAARAGCVPASIYARFKDKNSMLVALHESLRDRQTARIDQSTSPERHEQLSLDESLSIFCRGMAEYYSHNRNLLRPAYLLGDREIYERAGSAMRRAADRITVVIGKKVKIPAKSLSERVALATRSAYALLQQRMVFGDIAPGRHLPTSDEEMTMQLVSLFKALLLSPPRK
jgi:AcrR family transcriptional regulator